MSARQCSPDREITRCVSLSSIEIQFQIHLCSIKRTLFQVQYPNSEFKQLKISEQSTRFNLKLSSGFVCTFFWREVSTETVLE